MFEMSGPTMTFISLAVAVLVALWGFLKHQDSKVGTIRTELNAEIKAVAVKTEATREKLEADMKAQAEGEAKRRHDLANQLQQGISTMQMQHRTDFKEVNDRLDRMARETVRKEDMGHLEARLTVSLDKLEGKIDAMMVRLEQKVDAMRSPLSGPTHRREGA